MGPYLRPAPGASKSESALLDSAARYNDDAGAESDDPANDGRREADLDDGKRCSRCIDDEANDQPNDRPDHAYRSSTIDNLLVALQGGRPPAWLALSVAAKPARMTLPT